MCVGRPNADKALSFVLTSILVSALVLVAIFIGLGQAATPADLRAPQAVGLDHVGASSCEASSYLLPRWGSFEWIGGERVHVLPAPESVVDVGLEVCK